MAQLHLFPESFPNEFRRQGELWRIVYADQFTYQHGRLGLDYLAFLLTHPHRAFTALMLEQTVRGRVPIVAGSAGEVLTDETCQDYKKRLRDLEQELNDAKRFRDLARQDRLEQEGESLKAELARALGLGDKSARACDDLDRARRRVKMALSRALEHFEDDHPLLWAHLNLTVRTGRVLSYRPEYPIEWLL